jgi:hypothetical protein
MAEECADNRQNLGLSRCKNLPSLPKTMITTNKNFTFTAAEAVSESFWQDAILAGQAERVYLWPEFDLVEYTPKETAYQDTNLSMIKVKDAMHRWKASINSSMCLHRAMFSHSSRNARVILIDIENQWLVTKTGTDEYRGLSIDNLNVEALMFNDGSGVATMTPILVALKDSLEVSENGYTFKSTFVNSLERLTDVVIAIVGTPSATTIKCTVKVECDGTNVEGLVTADFALTTTLGVAQVITSVAYADGVYTLTDTDFASGFLNLVSAANLSIQAYESTGAATVTVV